MAQNGAESIPTDMEMSYLKTMLLMAWRTLFYEKRYSVDKSLYSKVSPSNTHKTPIDRCFRESNVLSDFRFEGKTDNFWKHFYEEFI